MLMSAKELQIRQHLKDDLPHYAERCLRIRAKSANETGGRIVPLVFNRAQLYVHEQLERQKAERGFVRAIILKGRQQGISTYVAARFYHHATHHRGTKVFILTHENAATANLFEIVDRYHQNCPSLVKPLTGAANANELTFPNLDSGYKVGTAGTKGVGRSGTFQLVHASEVAFWANAETHASGLFEAVPEEPGTEIILESTAQGLGNFFHRSWRDAERAMGLFIPIFVPWFWEERYRSPVPAGFALDDEEETYANTYGLDLEQMAWRRNKIYSLKDPMRFSEEYPATAAEAFQTTGHDSYIKPALILAARKNERKPIGPLVLGVDPARSGGDRFAIAVRQGRCVLTVEYRENIDVVKGATFVKQMIERFHPDRVFIDVGGLGVGVYDILMTWGAPYSLLVEAVNFGGSPQDEVVFLENGDAMPGAKNRRSEMWMRSREWLEDVGGVDIPDDDGLQADACAPGYSYDTNQRLLLEPKEKIKSRGLSSPDGWDAIALTFAGPVGDKALVWDSPDDFDFADMTRSQITGY